MPPLAQGFNILYREARPTDAQTLLLLHGFPSASHMFRHLVPGGEFPVGANFETSRQPAHCSISSRLRIHKSSRISRRTPYGCCLARAHAAAPA